MEATGLHDFFKREWRKLLLLLSMCLIYFFSYFQRIAVPGICFDELQRDFETTAAAITALGSVFLYIYGFAQFFVGVAADRFGGRRTMLSGASVLAGASILFPLSHSLPMLYLSRALMAVGASTIFLSLVKEIDTLFNPRHFAIWLGGALFIGYSGGIIGTYPFERAINYFGWRTAMFSAGILCLLILILAAIIFHKFPDARARDSSSSKIYLGAVLKNHLSYPPMIVNSINFSIYFLFQATIGKKMMTDCCGISSASAASIVFLMMIVCASVASLSGFISHLIGNRRKPIILASAFLMLTATVLLTVFAHDHPDYRILSGGLVIFALAAAPSPITISAVKEVNPGPAAATSVGVNNCVAYVSVAIVTNLAGLVMDYFQEQACLTDQAVIYPAISYRLILSGCAVLAAFSAVAALFIRETPVFPSRRKIS